MANPMELQKTFTSQDAVALFKEHTGFEFHPTVPGQLLARCGIRKIDSTSKPSRFDAKNWRLVWEEMIELALRRCKFDRRLQPPIKCLPPTLPQVRDPQPVLEKQYVTPVRSQVQVAAPAPQQQESPARAAIRAALEAARRAVKASAKIQDLKSHPDRQRFNVSPSENDEAKNLSPVLPQPQSPKPLLAEQQPELAIARHDVAAATTQAYDLKPHPTRQFIEVPFEEKDEAKWRGAKWDWTFKKWYVPTGLNRNLFHWPDALLPPAMRAVKFPPDETSVPRKSLAQKKKSVSSSKSTVAGKLLQKELNGRLQFLLDKPD